ncbi:hypothetical protein ACK8P5_26075 (plasmid) [Paenibacillus sp. EC2-1]|uniref:hypothetical protein n=1 Tax=Paenibacillus sp. EC2-1 TaxID=3388665 RepID=UPI003BEF1F40
MPNQFENHVASGETLPCVTFPGAYPIIYITLNGAILCADCASKEPKEVVKHDAYFEGPTIECDGGCGKMIESAYGNLEEVVKDED